MRMGFGLYFLADAWRKTTGEWLANGAGVASFVQMQQENATPLYGGFLTDIVLPNAGVFGLLVVAGEWAAGISLTLGLLTRLGAIVSMWLVLNFMLAKGLPNIEGSSDRLFFLAGLTFAVCSAGLAWGLDAAWRPVLGSNPVSRWLAGIPAPARAPREVQLFPERKERRAA
jgi:uncharacterized membrane protein YphA (DoxX/SURF4 family)